jgi:hypothetical protein
VTDKVRALRVVHCRHCVVEPTRIVWRNGGWYHVGGRKTHAAEPPLDYPGRRS